ncbi:MAG TPA: response regulator [Candidatus Binatia bacterium]|nr:response regulator [Candidatus Binatia bacterium]
MSQAPAKPVLVVEDSADIRDAISFVLESEGYKVRTAVDGLDAVAQLQAGLRPSLIMLDLAMPRMDGFEFRTWQSGDDRFAGIPVVVYSGAFDIDQVSQSLGVPAFRKPIDIDRMLDLVAAYAAL